ncbi:MAG: 50S ribosomal protein L20 [Patescibacteria group bacterium]
MRVKTGPYRHRKHREILHRARGYRMTRHRLLKPASEAVLHAGEYAFAGRKLRKRDFRRLWITRISARLSESGISYSRFISGLKKAKIDLDRKILADLAISDPETFKAITQKSRTILD